MSRFFAGKRGRSRFAGRSGHGRKNFGSRNHKIDVSRFINSAMKIEKTQAYIARHRFNDFSLDERLKRNVAHKGYLTPTPIQDQAIEPFLSGKDIVGIADTGTGKTAAFLLPLLNKVLLDRHEKVLIMAPTRELALQIQEELDTFSYGLSIRSVLCIGGAGIGRQIGELKRTHNFVIGTPGRLQDLSKRGVLHLNLFKNVILDEADRMLDMGFIDDIKKLLSLLPTPRQSAFFSATCSKEFSSLIGSFLCSPVMISVKVRETATNVQQDVIRYSGNENRMHILQDLLTQKSFQKVLIFGKTKYGVENLSVILTRNGFKADSIHGNKTQFNRLKTLRRFKENKLDILVATDVAARGLDIDNVSHVINYDVPATYDDYIHRIGRTGRAQKTGIALTFVEQHA